MIAKRLAVLLAALLLASAVDAQQILLKTGQRVETLGLRRDGDTVMGKIQVGTSSGEIGYPVDAIAKIEFPEPQGLKTAAAFLANGHPEKALPEIDSIVKFYAPFKDLPGAWWAPAALIRVSALSALRRETEVEPLALEIQKNAADPESARAASLRLVPGLARKQDFVRATQICDAVIKESSKPEVLAEAWISRGDVLFAQKHWDTALMAYLHVPIFYPNEKLSMPVALLGSVRAYRRLDDLDRANRSYKDLANAFPKSPETTLAQSEIAKMK